jgi:hypothetical protein
MSQEVVFKTVYQYSREPVSEADMGKLLEIAEDYRRVKNYVYRRYSGIGSLGKLWPGYTVQNEMTRSGLREELGMPSVYFYLAVFDALGDIKGQWARTKTVVEKNLRANQNLGPRERHYLRFVMKQDQCFRAILQGVEAELSGRWAEAFEEVRQGLDTRPLDQYLRRQVRRHLVQPRTEAAEGFSVPPKGYRYADHGIYLSVKEKHQRLFLPLTDSISYNRQLYVRLYPGEGRVVISAPVEVKPRRQEGYWNEIGLALGMRCLFVTDGGNAYGERFLEYQAALSDYIREKLPRHRRNARNNPGKKKYTARKARLEAALHTYVNGEINRMLEAEKPRAVYLPRLPGTSRAGVDHRINASVSRWQKGYVKNRLARKCLERSIEFAEVFGKGISSQCSGCGAEGEKQEDVFYCRVCGLKLPERQNTARNVLQRGREQEGGAGRQQHPAPEGRGPNDHR